MVDRLRHAVDLVTEKAQFLSEEEQEALAARLESIANDLRWDELLADPANTEALDILADEALAEYQAGKTHTLDNILRQHTP